VSSTQKCNTCCFLSAVGNLLSVAVRGLRKSREAASISKHDCKHVIYIYSALHHERAAMSIVVINRVDVSVLRVDTRDRLSLSLSASPALHDSSFHKSTKSLINSQFSSLMLMCFLFCLSLNCRSKRRDVTHSKQAVVSAIS
jgi:hypothetical protein